MDNELAEDILLVCEMAGDHPDWLIDGRTSAIKRVREYVERAKTQVNTQILVDRLKLALSHAQAALAYQEVLESPGGSQRTADAMLANYHEALRLLRECPQ